MVLVRILQMSSSFSLFQFFAWFNKVESQMEEDEEISYSSYCDQLKQYREQCDSVLDEVSTALTHLEELQKQYVFVSTKTNALHHACEESLQDQVCHYFHRFQYHWLNFQGAFNLWLLDFSNLHSTCWYTE